VFAGNASLARCAELLAGPLDHLPPEIRAEREALVVAFAMRAFADQSRLIDAVPPVRVPMSAEAFTEHLVGMILAMLEAPLPGPQRAPVN
jgi:hypothetical protein